MHLGIDLGGTKIEIVALDEHSRSHFRKRIASPQGNYVATLGALSQLVHEAEASLGSIKSLGLGIPGTVSTETGLVKNANSTWLIGHPIDQDLSKRLNIPVKVANDADCFALSEAIDGAASGESSVFGIILGTGVGGAICIDQKLISGPNSITGEWGHNPLPIDNRQETATTDPQTLCYCGKRNCLETYLSGPAFLKHFKHFSQHREDIVSPKCESAPELAKLLASGHPEAQAYFDIYLDRLARGLSMVINILDPDCIVFGGGLSNIDALYPRLEKNVSRYIFSDSVRTRFVPAMHGDASGVRGAAWLGKTSLSEGSG